MSQSANAVATVGQIPWNEIVTNLISAASLLIAVLALLYARSVDRRAKLQPYFARKWRRLHEPLVKLTREIEEWWSVASGILLAASSERLHAFPPVKMPPYESMNWAFDPKLKQTLDAITRGVEAVRSEVNELSKLQFITSEDLELNKNLESVGFPASEGHYEIFGGRDALREYIHNVCITAVGKRDASRTELLNSSAYQNQLAGLRSRIQQQMKELLHTLSVLDLKLDEYGTLFASSGGT